VGERRFVRACYPIGARHARFVRAVAVSAFCRVAGVDGV